jgi:hypothetical protein
MKKLIATLLLCTAALSTLAFAAEDFATSAPTTPFYAGVQIGKSNSIFGGYQIDKMFSAEVYYTNYDSYASSLGGYGVAMFRNLFPSAPQVSIFGKAGLVLTSVNSKCGPLLNCSSSSSLDVALGGGAQYDFNKRFGARVGLEFNKYNNSELYVSGLIRF